MYQMCFCVVRVTCVPGNRCDMISHGVSNMISHGVISYHIPRDVPATPLPPIIRVVCTLIFKPYGTYIREILVAA